MIGANDFFGEIFGSVPDGDISWNARIAKAMVRAGLAVVVISPQDKRPACTLTAKQAQAADLAAQQKAKEDGRLGWQRIRHACGIDHAITEERELTRVAVKRLLDDGANLAISVGKSTTRLMVADIDTELQMNAFSRMWQTEADGDAAVDIGLTVSSPGVQTVDGEWLHKHGGHIWFIIDPGTELPDRKGKFTYCPCHGYKPQRPVCPQAWALYWGSGYVLVPPSVRPEGPYRLVGSAVGAPAWLCDMARASVPDGPAEGSASVLGAHDGDPIDAWAAATPWADLLVDAQFTPAAFDSCGCQTWTRPGSPAHTKSVTAHEPESCTFPWNDSSSGHYPMHVWSDALGGDRSVTKLDFYAESKEITRSQAMDRLGLVKIRTANELAVIDAFYDLPKASSPVTDGVTSDLEEHAEDQDEESVTGALDWTQDPELVQRIKERAFDLYVNQRAREFLDEVVIGQKWTPPDEEDDLRLLLEQPAIEQAYAIEDVLTLHGNAMISASFKAGKTTLVLECVRALADQVPFLGTYQVRTSGRVGLWNYELDSEMMRDWMRDTNLSNPQNVRLLNLRGRRVPLETKTGQEFAVRWLAEREIRTWIIDPAVRAMIGWGDENDNGAVTLFTDMLDTIKERAGVSELIIAHHTGRERMDAGSERARGATRWDDWPDSRWILTRMEPPADTRFIRMDGRGKSLPERALVYDAPQRRVSLMGAGDPLASVDRKTYGDTAFRQKVLDHIVGNPGLTQNRIMEGVGTTSVRKIQIALSGLEDGRQIYKIDGPNRSKLWYAGGYEIPPAATSEPQS
jgi:hypothetical protein